MEIQIMKEYFTLSRKLVKYYSSEYVFHNSTLAIVNINIAVSVDTMHYACTTHDCSLFAAVR